MGMRRLLAVAACAAAVVGVGAGSAFAGEITGNGKWIAGSGDGAAARQVGVRLLRPERQLAARKPGSRRGRVHSYAELGPGRPGGQGVPDLDRPESRQRV